MMLQTWARSESYTRYRRGRGRGPTRSMAAPALRYCLGNAEADDGNGHERVRGEFLECIHQITERIGVQKCANDALQQQSAGSEHATGSLMRREVIACRRPLMGRRPSPPVSFVCLLRARKSAVRANETQANTYANSLNQPCRNDLSSGGLVKCLRTAIACRVFVCWARVRGASGERLTKVFLEAGECGLRLDAQMNLLKKGKHCKQC